MKFAVRAVAVLSLAFAPAVAEVAAVVNQHHPRRHSHHGRKTHSDSEGSASTKKSKAAGLPHLPPVSSMLVTASETLKSISSQATSLEARVVQVQTENEAKMARQKAVFDRRLRGQEEGNREIVNQNADITKEIAALKDDNVALRKHSKELQVDNRLMRIELQTLQAKLGVSHDFVATSLTSTDDSKAKELTVLKELDKEDHEDSDSDDSHDQDDDDDREDDSKDDDDDEDDSGASFLAVASKTQRSENAVGSKDAELAALDGGDGDGEGEQKPETMNPKDLLKVLQKGVENLAVEEKDGEAKLKKMFLSDFQAGSHRHVSLISQQKTLNSTRASVLQRKSQLKVAEAHLEHTKSHLQSRLRGLGLFLQKLAHVALAPANEVPKMIKALPSQVSIPSVKENKKE